MSNEHTSVPKVGTRLCALLTSLVLTVSCGTLRLSQEHGTKVNGQHHHKYKVPGANAKTLNDAARPWPLTISACDMCGRDALQV